MQQTNVRGPFESLRQTGDQYSILDRDVRTLAGFDLTADANVLPKIGRLYMRGRATPPQVTATPKKPWAWLPCCGPWTKAAISRSWYRTAAAVPGFWASADCW